MENKYDLNEREASFLLKKPVIELIHANSHFSKTKRAAPDMGTALAINLKKKLGGIHYVRILP